MSASSPGLVQRDVETVGHEWVSHVQSRLQWTGIERHSTLLTRERRGFPIWSAFEYDIRAFWA